jgi:general secretion pathway protein A
MSSPVLQRDGPPIQIAESLVALLRLEAEAGYERMVWGGVEFGGILLGTNSDNGTQVLEGVRVDCEHSYGPAFELSPKDEERLIIQLQQYGHRVVGWFRSTSRDLSLTATDQELYDRHFLKPEQVTLLIRRARGEAARFAVIRRDGAGIPRVLSEFQNGSAAPIPEPLQPVPEAVQSAPEPVRTLPRPVRPDAEPARTILASVQPSAEPVQAVPEPAQAPSAPSAEPAPPPSLPQAELESTPEPLAAPIPERVALPKRSPLKPEPATAMNFFGLRAAPFGEAADPAFFHPSPGHRGALTKLRYGIEGRKGFLLLTGEAGTGKTLLMRCLMQHLEKTEIQFSCLMNARVGVDEFFNWIALDMELPCATRRKSEVLIALVERLSGRQTALFVDDAHKLSADLLEELELLGNLQNRTGNLLQVVLAANSMLDDTLDQFRHRSLKQRIVVRARIGPLTAADTGAYIAARLRAAGWSGEPLFDDAVVERVWQRTSGVPRLINLLCDGVLETAFSEGARLLTPDLVDRTD